MKHGTTRGYDWYRCRCARCADAKNEYQRAYRARLRPAPEPCEDIPGGEQWRPIPGFEDLYRVSSEGRIYSLRRGRVLKGTPAPSGHLSLSLMRDGIRTQAQVHALVLLAFVGPYPAGLEIRHLDGDPANNRLENLRYGTRQENVQDAIRHGTHVPPPGRYRRAS